MDTFLYNDANIEYKEEDYFNLLRMDRDDDFAPEALRIFEEGRKIAKPKALYGIAYVKDRGEDWVLVEDICFNSKMLSLNLREAHRVFPYVATCGKELDEWAQSFKDYLERYWADKFCEMAVKRVYELTFKDFGKRLNLGKTAVMNPGSLPDWPISEQKKLFTLLGDKIKALGVELTDSFLMVPVKSISGIIFPTETEYENCMFCPRENCPNRRADYDPNAFEKRLNIMM